MEINRINFAKLQIFKYADTLFICLCELANPNLEESLNMPSHGLSKDELVVLLYELFSKHMLVAKTEERGLFTPTFKEIESALKEENDISYRSKNTFYGITTGAMETYRELKSVYSNKA